MFFEIVPSYMHTNKIKNVKLLGRKKKRKEREVTGQNRLHAVENNGDGQERSKIGDGVSNSFTTGEGITHHPPQHQYHNCTYY